MEYSAELQKAAKKYHDYVKKAEKYRSLFFSMKKEKWYKEFRTLYRKEWAAFAAKQMKVL